MPSEQETAAPGRVQLQPDTSAYLEATAAARFPPEALHDEALARDYLARVRSMPRRDQPVEPVELCEELEVSPGVRARVYVPTSVPGQAPSVLVYFHGGGWVSGDLDMHDSTCRRLANRVNAVVLNVDYRLAPEHRFPAAVDDAYAAAVWARAAAAGYGADPARFVLCGSSAGGNLVAAVVLRARDSGELPITMQVLIYPVLDAGMATASYRDFATGYGLSAAQLEWYWSQYVPEAADRDHPWASPLRAGSPRGLPPALIVTAECDPLRDEGESYAARLVSAGVPAEVVRYPGQVHGFMGMLGVIAAAEDGLATVVDRIVARTTDKGRAAQ